MATRALDAMTILSALEALDHELQATRWKPQNPTQRELFAWLSTYKEQLARITGLEAKASRFYEELNAFLANRGFRLSIAPFDSTRELGVVSVLDKLVRWRNGPGTLSDIATRRGTMPGFELPDDGVNIYEVEGYPGSYLLELLTQSDDRLWLFMHEDTGVEGLDLVKLSLDVMQRPRKIPMSRASWEEEAPTSAREPLIKSLVKRPLDALRRSRETELRADPGEGAYPTWAGAKVPMIDFDLTPDLAWLLGAGMITERGDRYEIVQAAQQFKMRMDETGARVKVATIVIVKVLSLTLGPKMFVVDRPFYGWWTQHGIDMPLAAFFADWDCWRKPAGSLEGV